MDLDILLGCIVSFGDMAVLPGGGKNDVGENDRVK